MISIVMLLSPGTFLLSYSPLAFLLNAGGGGYLNLALHSQRNLSEKTFPSSALPTLSTCQGIVKMENI